MARRWTSLTCAKWVCARFWRRAAPPPHVARVLNMDAHDGALTVPSLGPRMVCQACGAKGADVRPHWTEQKVHIPPPYSRSPHQVLYD